MAEREIKNRSGFLLAKIDYVVVIYEDGHQEVYLKVESENRSRKTIVLDKNYYIPLNEAFNIKARDRNSGAPLVAFENKESKRLEVVFKDGTRLPPGQKFIWTVKWDTTLFIKMRAEEKQLMGILAVNPGESYKEVPIKNHKVNIKVIFKRPRQGESYERVIVEQGNSRNLRAQIKEKEDEVSYTYEELDLVKGSTWRAMFLYRYQPADAAKLIEQKPTLIERCSKLVPSTVRQIFSKTGPTLVTTLFKEILRFIISRLKF